MARPASTSSTRNRLIPNDVFAADFPPEISRELHELTTFALRAYLLPSWSRVTPYDRDLLPSIARVLAHVLNALQVRLRNADLDTLVLQTIPALVAQHVTDYRLSQPRRPTSLSLSGPLATPCEAFHQLQPHIALDPQGSLNPLYVRAALDHVLAHCLPPEDYAPEAERTLVTEIALKVVCSVLPRVTQPWFLHKLLLDQLGPPPRSPTSSTSHVASVSQQRQAFSFSRLFVAVFSFIQAISTACLAFAHAYTRVRETVRLVNNFPSPSLSNKPAIIPQDKPTSPSPPAFSRTLSTESGASTHNSFSPSASPITTSSSPPPSAAPPDCITAPLALLSALLNCQDRHASSALMLLLNMSLRPFLPFWARCAPLNPM